MHKVLRVTKSAIKQLFTQAPKIGNLREAIAQRVPLTSISGLPGSSLSFVLSALFEKSEHPFLLVFDDKEEAAYYLNDLEHFLGDTDVLFFPGSYRRPYQIEETDNANVLLRAEVLNRINSRRKPAVIVTYPDALFEKVVTRKELDKSTLKIQVLDSYSLDFLKDS